MGRTIRTTVLHNNYPQQTSTMGMKSRPDIFILSADSLHFRAFQQFSGDLAALVSGVEFTRAIATASETNSAIPGLAAGVFSATVPGWGLPDEGAPNTLAEVLSRAGYSCGLWSDNYLFGPEYNYNAGLDAGNRGEASRKKRIANLMRKLPTNRPFQLAEWAYFNVIGRGKNWLGEDETFYKSASELHGSALDWLADGGETPRMCWIHYMDTHHPYEPPKRYIETESFHRHRSASELSQLTRDIVKSNGKDATEEEIKDVRTAYTACCKHLGDEVISFVEQLEEDGHFDPDEDIFVFTADHGECLDPSSFRMMGHHPPTFWEDIVHVPLIVNLPNWAETTVRDQVSLIDIMPTVLRSVDLPIPETAEGRPADRPTDLEREHVVFESQHRPNDQETMNTYRGIRSETGIKAFGARLDDSDTYVLSEVRAGEESIEYCDVAQPDGENLWIELVGELEKQRGPPIEYGATQDIDSDVQDHLRDLGYVD